MAKIYYGPSGAILAFAKDLDEDVNRVRVQPTGQHAASPLVFDEIANATLVADMGASTDAYRIVSGALQKSGIPQVIAPDHPATGDEKFIRANQAALFTALRAGSATNQQAQRVLAFLLRKFLQG